MFINFLRVIYIIDGANNIVCMGTDRGRMTLGSCTLCLVDMGERCVVSRLHGEIEEHGVNGQIDDLAWSYRGSVDIALRQTRHGEAAVSRIFVASPSTVSLSTNCLRAMLISVNKTHNAGE